MKNDIGGELSREAGILSLHMTSKGPNAVAISHFRFTCISRIVIASQNK